MSLSIITPHFNDEEGLKRIYTCLQKQTLAKWEWIIVDDFSDNSVLLTIESWIKAIDDLRVRFIENSHKCNASVCRNKGAEEASFDHLVFLDADDYISQDFVLNRDVEFTEFVVFKNMAVIDRNGTHEIRPTVSDNYLDCFLSANFIWQTTAILWKKSFFTEIGKFDPHLERLQDVELSIRALFLGSNFKVIDNEIDFFYHAQPIRLKTDIVRKSCVSVNYLILKLDTMYAMDAHRRSLVKSFYYACVKNLHRSSIRAELIYIKESLKLFYDKNYINIFQFFVGYGLLIFYQYKIISDSLFIRANRFFFKN